MYAPFFYFYALIKTVDYTSISYEETNIHHIRHFAFIVQGISEIQAVGH